MKKISYSLLTIFVIILFAACSHGVTSHKHKMIDAINRGDYASAVSHISQVDNWDVDIELDLNYGIPFLLYADSLEVDSALIDSAAIYIGKQLEEIAITEFANGNYEAAVQQYDILLGIYTHFIGTENLYVAKTYSMVGVILCAMGDYENAEIILSESVKIWKTLPSLLHLEYLYALLMLSESSVRQKKYEIAEQYYLASLALAPKLCRLDSETYLSILGNVGSLYLSMENFSKAEEYLVDSIGVKLDMLKRNDSIAYHEFYSTHMNNLGYLYRYKGMYGNALSCFLEEKNSRKISNDTLSLEYVVVLHNIGALYSDMYDHNVAEQYCVDALKCYNSISSDTLSLEYLHILSTLGDINTYKRNYLKAEMLYLMSIKIYNSISNDPLELAKLYSQLGILYTLSGKYALAENYFSDALEICKSLNNMHLTYVTITNLLGQLYVEQGDYKLAEETYLKSLKIQQNSPDKYSQEFANTLVGLGKMYGDMGDFDRCEKNILKGLDIWKNNGCDRMDSLNIAFTLENLGLHYQRNGDEIKAEQCMTESQRILNHILDASNIQNSRSKCNLALYYSNQGKDSLALKMYLECVEVMKYTFKEFPDDHMAVLTNIASCYANLGSYENAEEYHIEALKICEVTMGKSHPKTESYLSNLGWLYVLSKLYDKAEPYFVSAFTIHKDNYLSSVKYMTENQRKLYLNTFRAFFDYNSLHFAYRYHFSKPSISTFAYNNELFRKGLLLSSSDAIRRSVLESGNNTLITQYDELTSIKQIAVTIEEKDPLSHSLEQIRLQADSLEKIITASSAAYRENQAIWQITWDSVRNHLSHNEVAIEYFSAPLSEDSTMYCALLLHHDSEYPELIPLFEEKEITTFLSAESGNITNKTYDFYANGDTISQLVWSKIQPKLKGGETIYFAPSGLLHQLAIEYLPYDENRTMSDVYNMVRLSSTREIVLNKSQGEYTTASIYGGIQYDLDADNLLAESERYAKEDLLASRSIENDTLNRGNVQYLPGTKKEAETINALLTQNNISANLYTTSKANEESFKSLSGKHNNIIHIGTHGFTWTDSTARKQDYFTQRMQLQTLDGNNHLATPTIDPLTRCGLLFAGSNIALSGHSNELPDGVHDGILTAKEISLMDLRDADLVVLSACETAKGDITSEGVFGLQRAFKMAGVQTIIMSLWKVNDQATQLLMTEFYNNWIVKHQSKREAFRNAQNTVRTQYEEPEYWAGFIMLD